MKKLNNWVPPERTKKKKSSFWSVVFSLTACHDNQPFLHQSVMCDRKWILYDSRRWPAQWLNEEEVPKHFPEPDLHQKKVIITFGGLLLVWCTIAFWIPVKALHLRSVLSRVMRITENCSACGQRWTTEGAQAFRTKPPSWHHPASTSEFGQVVPHLPHSPDLEWTNYHLLKHLYNFL